jgi:hypothetical protein
MGYLGSRTNGSSGGVNTFSLTKPTECVTDGWLFAIFSSNMIPGTHSLTPPDGTWSLVTGLASGTTSSTLSNMQIYRKKVLASEAGVSGPSSYAWTVNGGARTYSGAMLAYDGLNTTNPIAAVAIDEESGASDTTVFCPSVTTTANNQLVIRAATIRATTASFTTLASHSERVDYAGLVDFSVNWQEINQAVAGSTGTTSITASASGQHIGATLALDTSTTTRVTKDADLRWKVQSLVSKDTDLRWRVSSRVSQDIDLRWVVLPLVATRDVDLRWKVAALVERRADLRWRVESLLPPQNTRGLVPKVLVSGAVAPKIRADGSLT